MFLEKENLAMACSSICTSHICYSSIPFQRWLRSVTPKYTIPLPNFLEYTVERGLDLFANELIFLVCFYVQIACRYGNVYSLFLGKRPAVMLHGLQAVREALMMRATDFAGRPQGLMINHVTDSKGVKK